MNALPLRFSAAPHDRSKGTTAHAMPPDQIAEAVKTAQQVTMSSDAWYNLGLAFLLGGSVSAVWTWREARRKPQWREIISTFFVSGMIAVAFVSYLLGKIDTPMVIVISILCGFSGDSIIRIAVQLFGAFVSRVMGTPKGQQHPPTEE